MNSNNLQNSKKPLAFEPQATFVLNPIHPKSQIAFEQLLLRVSGNNWPTMVLLHFLHQVIKLFLFCKYRTNSIVNVFRHYQATVLLTSGVDKPQ